MVVGVTSWLGIVSVVLCTVLYCTVLFCTVRHTYVNPVSASAALFNFFLPPFLPFPPFSRPGTLPYSLGGMVQLQVQTDADLLHTTPASRRSLGTVGTLNGRSRRNGRSRHSQSNRNKRCDSSHLRGTRARRAVRYHYHQLGHGRHGERQRQVVGAVPGAADDATGESTLPSSGFEPRELEASVMHA